MDNVQAGFDALNGYQSQYGSSGCVDAVVKAGSWFNPDLKAEADNGVAYVPTLVDDMSKKGYSVESWNGQANRGDILVYGDDDHVVIADGNGGAFGNSSSKGQAMKYSDLHYAWGEGEAPTKVIRTGGQVNNINTQYSPDGSNINVPIQMQVDDPNEQLRTDLIRRALMTPQGNVAQHVADEDSLVLERMADQHGRGVDTKWLQSQMDNRRRLIAAAAEEEQNKLNTGAKLTRVGELAKAIADSKNSSNSKMYASVAAALGVPLDSMQGRYITQNELALQQIQQNAQIAAQKRDQQFKMDVMQKEQENALAKMAYGAQLDVQKAVTLASMGLGGRGSSSGGSKGMNLNQQLAYNQKATEAIKESEALVQQARDYIDEHPDDAAGAMAKTQAAIKSYNDHAAEFEQGTEAYNRVMAAMDNDINGNYGGEHTDGVGLLDVGNQIYGDAFKLQ